MMAAFVEKIFERSMMGILGQDPGKFQYRMIIPSLYYQQLIFNYQQ